MKLNFVSNLANGYGNRIASDPSNLSVLGYEIAQVSLCESAEFFWTSASGNITVSRRDGLYLNNAECSVILAPFGANTIIIDFQAVSIECSSINMNSTRETAWENSSFRGTCSSCDFDFLQVDECFDSTCEYTRLVSRICGSDLASWTQTTASHIALKRRLVIETGYVMLTFHSDNVTVSTGFNATFRSFPSFEVISEFVPGQDDMSFVLSRSDKFQSIVRAKQDSWFVKALVCHPDNPECSDLNSVVPASFFSASEDSLFRVPSSFIKCIVGESDVVIHFAVLDLHNYQRVSCLPCQYGQSKMLYQNAKLWSCVACSKYQYVVDPNRFQCQDCPKGATCNGRSLQGRLAGSIWEPDNVTGQFILRSCPQVI